MRQNGTIIYREVQRPKQMGLWIAILLNTGVMWYWFIQQIIFGIPIGNNPVSDGGTIVICTIFGVGLPLFTFGIYKLIIEVRNEGIYIRFFPFKYKFIPFKDITNYESITYNPIKQFGGWGYRLNSDYEFAYTMGGKQAVKLKLKDKTVTIGTKDPQKLVDSIDSEVNS